MTSPGTHNSKPTPSHVLSCFLFHFLFDSIKNLLDATHIAMSVVNLVLEVSEPCPELVIQRFFAIIVVNKLDAERGTVRR
jgi:hypothetical protein